MKKKKLLDTILPSGRKLGDVTPVDFKDAASDLKALPVILVRRGLTLEHYGKEIETALLSGVGIVKTTVRLPRSLWQAARKRAIDDDRTFESLVLIALAEYLHLPAGIQELAEAKAKELNDADLKRLEEGSR